MIELIDTLFRIDRYTERAEKAQARMIVSFAVIMMVMFYIFALFFGVGDSESAVIHAVADRPQRVDTDSGHFRRGRRYAGADARRARRPRQRRTDRDVVSEQRAAGTPESLRLQRRRGSADAAHLLFGLFMRARGVVIGFALGLISLTSAP